MSKKEDEVDNDRTPTDEWISILSAVAFVAFGLAVVWVFPKWNPNYTPVRPWVWAVPGVLCLVFYTINVMCILASARRTSRIGAMDSGISLALSAVTLLFIAAPILLGTVTRGPFQVMEVVLITMTMLSETVTTFVGRIILNRRNIGLGS